MTISTPITSREHWLKIAASIITDEVITPVINIPAPAIRYSLTAPKTGHKKGTILGECWNRAASADDHNEIFITSNLDDSLRILDVLLHEMIHAYDNNQHGHGPEFQRLCKMVGLQGGNNGRSKESFTSTIASPELADDLQDIIDTIGPIPHAAMNTDLSGKPKQKNRQLLVECNSCGFKFRASQKTIDSITRTNCLSCDHGHFLVKQ